MQLITPIQGENYSQFVDRFMSDSNMKTEFKEDSKRKTIAYSIWRSAGKEHFCMVPNVEFKMSDSGELIKSGYIATTHRDSGFYDPERKVYVRDTIAKSTLDKWAKELNDGVPRANKVSVNHNRQPHVAGVSIKGSAKVEKLPDGHYGLWADTLVDKTRADFADTKYKIENGLIDSHSIEFTTKNIDGSYIDGAVIEMETSPGVIDRTLLPNTILEGYTLASQPMNEYAIMVKELFLNPKTEETPKMTETQVVQLTPEQKELIEKGRLYEQKVALEQKEKEKVDLHKAWLESYTKELKEKGMAIVPESKIRTDNGNDNPTVMEYKEIFKKDSNIDVTEQFKIATRLAESKGMFKGNLHTKEGDVLNREFKYTIRNSGGKCNLEFKGLGITTNQNTDTEYLLSSAELNDVFDPVIYNLINQQTVFWNLLRKEDFSGKGNNLVQFKVKTTANSTASAYTGNAVSVSNTGRTKYQTQMKKYQVGVEVDGDMIAAARGSVSDAFSLEVQDATIDLLKKMNDDLFAEVGLESAAGVIGLEFIADGSGNATMYNMTRSSANYLLPTAYANTYINVASADITPSILRQMKRQSLKEKAMFGDLVFVTSYEQADKFRGIYDAMQRTVPTSARFGFEGRPEFDGIPIFEDISCNSDDWFLVDLASHKVAIWVPPTLEMLGKDSDSQKGFIKTYFATYNIAPRRLVMAYGCAT